MAGERSHRRSAAWAGTLSRTSTYRNSRIALRCESIFAAIQTAECRLEHLLRGATFVDRRCKPLLKIVTASFPCVPTLATCRQDRCQGCMQVGAALARRGSLTPHSDTVFRNGSLFGDTHPPLVTASGPRYFSSSDPSAWVPPLRSPSTTPSLSKLESQLKIGCAYLR